MWPAKPTGRRKIRNISAREGPFHIGIHPPPLQKGRKIPPCPSNNAGPAPGSQWEATQPQTLVLQ